MNISVGKIDSSLYKMVGRVWEMDRIPIDTYGVAIQRNNENLAEIFNGRNNPNVLILASGRCVEFSLPEVVAQANQVTLVDIYDIVLREAYQKVPRDIQEKVELAQADISVFDSKFYHHVSTLIEQAGSGKEAMNELCRSLQDASNFRNDPLSWYTRKADLVLLIDSITPMVHCTLKWFEQKVIQRWGPKSYKGYDWEMILDVEGRFYRAFMEKLKPRISDGGLVYAVVLHKSGYEVTHSEEFYRGCFSAGFRIIEGILPYKIVNEDIYSGSCNISYLLEPEHHLGASLTPKF